MNLSPHALRQLLDSLRGLHGMGQHPPMHLGTVGPEMVGGLMGMHLGMHSSPSVLSADRGLLGLPGLSIGQSLMHPTKVDSAPRSRDPIPRNRAQISPPLAEQMKRARGTY